MKVCYILRCLDYFGKEGMLNGDEKVKFDVMVGKEQKEHYKQIKLNKGDYIELKFKMDNLNEGEKELIGWLLGGRANNRDREICHHWIWRL